MPLRFALKLAILSCTSLTLIGTAAPAFSQAQAERTFRLDIPAGPLALSLVALADQTGVSVYAPAELVRGLQAPQVKGTLTSQQAADRLLEGSGLSATRAASGGFTISRARPLAESGGAQRRQAGLVEAHEASPGAGDNAEAGTVAEVIVTAQKKEERLLDVPMAVSSVSAKALVASNQIGLSDYYSTIPGLSFTSRGQGDTFLSIRGVSTGAGTNPTVGVVIDDVPFGSSTALATNDTSVIPDLDPSDIARIEVLQGPQGTLYGASSIGGLLKYTMADPSTQTFSGQVSTNMFGVNNGNRLGYGVRGAVNIPVSDDLAVRASGFVRQDPGYVDDPSLHERGVNTGEGAGGRLALLWKPVDAFTAKFGALYQDTKVTAHLWSMDPLEFATFSSRTPFPVGTARKQRSGYILQISKAKLLASPSPQSQDTARATMSTRRTKPPVVVGCRPCSSRQRTPERTRCSS